MEKLGLESPIAYLFESCFGYILLSMKEIDLHAAKKVHFIGIGGIGVSAVARMMLLEGKRVTGSDTTLSHITDELVKLGAKIKKGQGIELVPSDSDLIIYTIAVTQNDPDLLEKIAERGILAITYPQALRLISKEKFTIAVSGTHG